MEGSKTEEKVCISRVDADRLLRGYGKMADALRSAGSWGQKFGDSECFDEASISAQMYSLRSRIHSVEDTEERMFLYYYYIKRVTLQGCAQALCVSLRTVARIKNRALDSIIEKMS